MHFFEAKGADLSAVLLEARRMEQRAEAAAEQARKSAELAVLGGLFGEMTIMIMSILYWAKNHPTAYQSMISHQLVSDNS